MKPISKAEAIIEQETDPTDADLELALKQVKDASDVAYNVYSRALDEHPEWWEGYNQESSDALVFADKIYCELVAFYDLSGLDESELIDIFNHIFAGLT